MTVEEVVNALKETEKKVLAYTHKDADYARLAVIVGIRNSLLAVYELLEEYHPSEVKEGLIAYLDSQKRSEVIQDIENYLKTCKNPDAHFMAVEDKEYNLSEIIKEIKARTELGDMLYEAWISLSEKEKLLKGVI